MTFEEFSAEIKSMMPQYVSAGLVDDMSIYGYMLEGLSEISILPTIRIETIINIKNNKGKLPDGFKSLYSAIKCEPYVMTTDQEEPKDILQEIYTYKVRETNNKSWSTCDPCDVVETDSCVVEKVYLHNGTRANLYYNNLQPIKLKLTPYIKKTKCDKECKNFNQQSPHEISINNKYVYTNFKEGNIYMIYNGYEEDDEGFVMIPETTENNLLKFLKAFVIREFLRAMFRSSDNTTNEQFLYGIYNQDVIDYKPRATGELKMAKILPNMKNYARKIKREFEVYNFGTYNHNRGNRIDFIVL